MNTITVTASDLAGNVTITNLSVTLDYTTATNPPVMQLIWPTNGAHLSGENFYIRGWINDETANVKAQIVDGGVTNEFAGLVERNGTFWVEDLPLVSGTNLVTLVAEDAAGNLSSTNLSVVKSRVTLTITSTPEGESLYEPYGPVAGTVSDPAYSVTVNGVPASVDESGNWSAENVPVYGRGTAIFDAVAAATGGGSPPVRASVAAEMPAYVAVVNHKCGKSINTSGPGDSFSTYERDKSYTASLKPGPSGDWISGFLGTATDRNEYNNGWDQAVWQWTATNRSTHVTDSTPSDWSSTNILNDMYQAVTGVPDKVVRELGWVGGPGGVGAYPPTFLHHYYARGVRHEWKNLDGSQTKATVSARTEMKLYTGGKAGIKRRSPFQISASAEQYGRLPNGPWLHTPATPVAPTKIQVLGKQLGNDGKLWLTLPDNEDKYLNLHVPGVKHYGAWATATKHKLTISANSYLLAFVRVRPNARYCVWQKMNFEAVFVPSVPGLNSVGPRWYFTGEYVNHQYEVDPIL